MPKRTKSVTSSSLIPNLVFNEASNSNKIAETGFQVDLFLGAIDTAKACGVQKPVIIANSDAVVHFVVFGATAAMAAPTGLTDGVMIPPNSLRVLSSGSLGFVRADSALVGAYVALESILADAPDQRSV